MGEINIHTFRPTLKFLLDPQEEIPTPFNSHQSLLVENQAILTKKVK